jgi:hypothetical protein
MEIEAKVALARFPMTYCSQCGNEQGPGNEGVSHCSDHRRQPQVKPAEFIGMVDVDGEQLALYRGVSL